MRVSRVSATTLVLLSVSAFVPQSAHLRNIQAAAGSTAADPAHQQSPAAPTLKVYSRETIVDVTVTDSQGNPVHGLKQSDFIVDQDGKPQAIRSFQEFSPTATAVQSAPVLPPNTHSNRRPAATGGALNIILVDLLRMNPLADGVGDSFAIEGIADSISMQIRVKQAAEQYLRTMPPGTSVAVLSLTPGHLNLLQDFTSDRDLLSADVRDMPISTAGTAASSAVVVRANSGPGGVQTPTTDLEITCMAQTTRDRATLDALNQLSASLASIKGRKNLMWFSPGFPSLTDPSFNAIKAAGCLADYSVALNQALALLAAAQVAVYPISTTMVHMPDLESNPASPSAGYSVTAAQDLSLETMAEATGGAAYYNTNDLAGALAKAVQTGSDYYTLSYVPPGAELDTRRHSISVRTNLPGAHLTYRDTYVAEDPSLYAPAPVLGIGAGLPHTVADRAVQPAQLSQAINPGSEKKFAAAFHTAMAHGSAESPQILFDIHFDPSVEPTPSSDPALFGTLDRRYRGKLLARYAFRSSLDASQLALVTGDDLVYHGAVDFTLAAFDAESKQVTALTQTVAIRLDDYGYKQFLRAPFALLQQLDLPSGHYFLRAGILDRTSGRIGTVEFPIDVPNLLPIPITSLHSLPAAQPARPAPQPSDEPIPALQRRPQNQQNP